MALGIARPFRQDNHFLLVMAFGGRLEFFDTSLGQWYRDPKFLWLGTGALTRARNGLLDGF